MTNLELIATVFGVASVALTIRQNIWCWPTGLVMVCLYFFVFFRVRLYSDMALQVVYVVLQIMGWYKWHKRGKDGRALSASRLSSREFLAWGVACLGGTALLGLAMSRLTNAALPFWDANTTATSLVAQWLMNRKKLESWYFWIAVDVISVGIYLVKGLNATAVLYVVFLAMAVTGFLTWKKNVTPLPA